MPEVRTAMLAPGTFSFLKALILILPFTWACFLFGSSFGFPAGAIAISLTNEENKSSVTSPPSSPSPSSAFNT